MIEISGAHLPLAEAYASKVSSRYAMEVGADRIDFVIEGGGKRLAVECDGERWHGPEKLADDMARQAIPERPGWCFARIRGSQFSVILMRA